MPPRHKRIPPAVPTLVTFLLASVIACGDDSGGSTTDAANDASDAIEEDGDDDISDTDTAQDTPAEPDLTRSDADAAPDSALDADADTGAGEPLLHVPSPDWRDQVIYFVFTDRFEDGDPSNNDQGAGEYDPSRNSHYSGGDLQGIIDRLDYIESLGVTAIWITPPVANQWWDPQFSFGGFHGYWARDFKAVDEHYGTLETYQALSDALHRRGMYLIQDIVTNHTGNFFTYGSNYNPDDVTEGFAINAESAPTAAPTRAPFDQNDVDNPDHVAAAIYHWTPTIADFTDPDQEQRYQLSDLDDLNTESPVVREALRDAYGYWIREVGVDAFRVDTVKFVEHPFWVDFFGSTDATTPGIHAAAAATGRDDFLAFGEVFEASDPFDDEGELKMAGYLGTAENPELPAVLAFPLYEEISRVIGGGLPTRSLTYRLERFMDTTLFPDPFRSPTFIDNHDVQRFLTKASYDAFEQALTVLLTLPGIPVIYYGTEQRFEVPRAAMFAEGWQSRGVDHFNTDSATFGLVQELVELRLDRAMFRRGTLEVLQDSVAGPGIFAYRRTLDGESAIVIVNTADEEPILANNIDTGIPEGTRVTTEIGRPSLFTRVGNDGLLTAELGPRELVVLRTLATVVAVPDPTVSITIDTPLQGETFSEDVTITGSVDPTDTALMMVVDDYLESERTSAVPVESEGSFEIVLPVSTFPFGPGSHTVTFYAPDAGEASPRFAFDTDIPFVGEVIVIEDPLDDDTGPNGTYSYPTDATFGRQGDIEQLTVRAGLTTLILEFEMRQVTTTWNPTQDFDHVSFNIYFDFPDEEGLTFLPRINSVAPEGFDWNVTHFATGWENGTFSTEEASRTVWGSGIAAVPVITSEPAVRTISFSYDRTSFGLPSWEGVGIYATVWDFDGIDARYRPLATEGTCAVESCLFQFVGGDGLDGRFLACSTDTHCRAFDDPTCCTPNDEDNPTACVATFCSCGDEGICVLDAGGAPVHADPLILDDVDPIVIPEIVIEE